MRTIALDVDGVLADFLTAAEVAVGKSLTYGTWDIPSRLSSSEWEKFAALGLTEGVCLGLDPIEGAMAFLQALRSKYQVIALTCPWAGSSHWLTERRDWLVFSALFKEAEIVHCPSGLKPWFASDYLVEDRPSTAYAWAKKNRHGNAFLLRRPWNRLDVLSMDSLPNLLIVDSYRDIQESLKVQ